MRNHSAFLIAAAAAVTASVFGGGGSGGSTQAFALASTSLPSLSEHESSTTTSSGSTFAESSASAQLRLQERLADRVDRLTQAGLWHTSSASLSSSQAGPAGSSGSHLVRTERKAPRPPLTGRFIHITDFHPDPHYRSGASLDQACHRKDPGRHKKKKKKHGKHGKHGKGKKGKGNALEEEEEDDDGDAWDDDEDEAVSLVKKPKAGYWGTAVSDCDSPMTLVNSTLGWLAREWGSGSAAGPQVDFVVWTGDSARHDLDREVPRTPGEIYDLNRMMTRGLREAFGEGVVIVPSIGNNDIYREYRIAR